MQETTNKCLTLEVQLIFFNVKRSEAFCDIKLNNRLLEDQKHTNTINLSLLIKIESKSEITSCALRAGRARNMYYLNTRTRLVWFTGKVEE